MGVRQAWRLGAAALVAGLFASQQASAVDLVFEELVFMSCQDVHDLPAADRQAVGEYLAQRSASYRGVEWPLPGEFGDDVGVLAVAACTMNPSENLFSVIDRVIVATYPAN